MTTAIQSTTPNPIRAVLGNRDFRLLWIGQATSLFGDQFHMIALPWLVLQLTGDALALGTVLALGSIPRALLMLFGGAVSDRFSPRAIMLISDAVRLVITGLMAVQVLTGTMEVWMIYVYSLILGIVSGFFMPASQAMVPSLLPGDQLQAGNSVFTGTMQLIGFIGPAIAGATVAAFGKSTTGVALAIIIDAVSFLVSTLTLWWMVAMKLPAADATQSESVWGAIRAGISYVVHDPVLRLVFIVIAAANLLFSGPVGVGMPVLANSRLAEGAAAFGLILSGYAGGNLIGILLAGTLPHPKSDPARFLTVGLLIVFAFGLASFAWLTSTWMIFAVMLAAGVGNGYLAITFLTTLQRNTPKAMLGRVMSMFMLSNIGLAPISQAVAGVISRWSVSGLFIGVAVLMLLLALSLLGRSELKLFADQLAAETVTEVKQ
jgi:MFS family permease